MSWFLVLPALIIWVAILLLPWRPWSVKERFEEFDENDSPDLSNITALVPARNEADVIKESLTALSKQGIGLNIIVIDDQSTDNTASVVRNFPSVHLIEGVPLPTGWIGKLWALEQGYRLVKTEFILLLDADIKLSPGVLSALMRKMKRENISLISLMAKLRMETYWEKLLIPGFIYFFKLLYPFGLSNQRDYRNIAAAAGGCMLVTKTAIDEIEGFQALRHALIDDCALARRIKLQGNKIWIGLTKGAESLRSYTTLQSIWDMVARTAFTQLNYSFLLLLGLTVIFALAFWLPIFALFASDIKVQILASIALLAMAISYLPTLKFYGVAIYWIFSMPVMGTYYLAMTWSSAIRYWQGQRSEWKGRVYQ